MRYTDLTWDYYQWGIKFDAELNLDKLGWNSGDLFKIANVIGQAMLRKIDPLIAFVSGGALSTPMENLISLAALTHWLHSLQ